MDCKRLCVKRKFFLRVGNGAFPEKILGDDDPETLLHTVYLLLGQFFTLFF